MSSLSPNTERRREYMSASDELFGSPVSPCDESVVPILSPVGPGEEYVQSNVYVPRRKLVLGEVPVEKLSTSE
ncbi:cytosolic Fe-S cluster assembly factor nar-1 [Acrasis kona]|uniref:Cytosolic Fe-S cluster assembly factor nar-1 n=1 Tax=Acrasis kona TaxID=1008807 RepID=A0AAW2ZPN2_9EUKA